MPPPGAGQIPLKGNHDNDAHGSKTNDRTNYKNYAWGNND
jgi:hypothetical protein